MDILNENELIRANFNKIQDKANKIYVNNFIKPSEKEYIKVKKYVLEFIKKRGRIIYGGFAQNELIKSKNKNDDFYGESRYDVEFFTPEPIKDVIDLCDELENMGIEHVRSEEGVHDETYKIFANFENYCDISYMQKEIFDNCPVVELNGLKYLHPHFMLVDAYRIYTDIASTFRLERSYNRFSLLEKHFPIEPALGEIHYPDKEINDDIKKYVRQNFLHNSNHIVVGHYAVEYLLKKVNTELNNYPYYEIISNDLQKSHTEILQKLRKAHKNISYKKFYKFFMFLDERVEFYKDGHLFLIVYGNNKRCIPYLESIKKKTKFGSYHLIILYLLARYFFFYVNKNKVEQKNYSVLLRELVNAKEIYLDEHNLTALEPSKFQYFVYNCIGEPENPLYESRLRQAIKRKLKQHPIKFGYTPTKGKKGKVPNKRFPIQTGTEKVHKN